MEVAQSVYFTIYSSFSLPYVYLLRLDLARGDYDIGDGRNYADFRGGRQIYENASRSTHSRNLEKGVSEIIGRPEANDDSLGGRGRGVAM